MIKMKRNKDLDEAFTAFIDDLKLFLKETKQFSKDKSQKIESYESKLHEILMTPDVKLVTTGKRQTINVFEDDEERKSRLGPLKFSEDPVPLMDDANESRRIRKLAHNANFLYCFSLFESYASKIVKITFKHSGKKNSPKERYIHKFQEFAEKEAENQNHRYTRMYRDDQKMLNNYDKLSGHINLWIYMLGIDKNGIFNKYIRRYDEARERRNLLTHRSIFRDEKYIKSFKEIHSKPDGGKSAQKFLDETCETFAIKKDKNNFDMSVTPRYFEEVFQMLLVISSLFYIYSFKPSKQEIEIGTFFPNFLLHELMCFSREIRNITSLESLASIVVEYKKKCAKDNWKNVPAQDKLNLLIIYAEKRDYYVDLKPIISKKFEKSKELEKALSDYSEITTIHANSFDKLRKEITPSISIKFKNELKLIESYIDGDIEELIKYSKQAKLNYEDLDKWFIFQKYEKNKKFKKYLNSLRPDHTLNVVNPK